MLTQGLGGDGIGAIVAQGLTLNSEQMQMLENFALLLCTYPPFTQKRVLPIIGDVDVYTVHSIAVSGVYNRLN